MAGSSGKDAKGRELWKTATKEVVFATEERTEALSDSKRSSKVSLCAHVKVNVSSVYARYSLYTPLHELWEDYMKDLLQIGAQKG